MVVQEGGLLLMSEVALSTHTRTRKQDKAMTGVDTITLSYTFFRAGLNPNPDTLKLQP